MFFAIYSFRHLHYGATSKPINIDVVVRNDTFGMIKCIFEQRRRYRGDISPVVTLRIVVRGANTKQVVSRYIPIAVKLLLFTLAFFF